MIAGTPHGSPPYRRVAQISVLLGSVLAAGCVSQSYRIGLELAPANRAVVLVKGKKSFVIVENRGPGSVDVDFDGTHVLGDQQRHLRRGDTGPTMHGPARVTIETGPESGAEVEVRARGAVRVVVERAPSPKR
ncbi:MAG: hypothetical protein ACE5GW_09060 [Planctomycetota bacterium]